MNSAPTQLVVASPASSIVTNSPQIQNEFFEEPLIRQNTVGNRARGSLKGKHLIRSHAMRESASPPRTPTPRSEHVTTSPISFSPTETTASDSKLHVQSSTLPTSPTFETQNNIMASNNNNNSKHHHQQNSSNNTTAATNVYPSNENNGNTGVVCNQSQLDVDFPKLTPPKSSKSPRNLNNGNRELGEKTSNTIESNKGICNSTSDSISVNNSNGKTNSDFIKLKGHNNCNPTAPVLVANEIGSITHQSQQIDSDILSPIMSACSVQTTTSCPQVLQFEKDNRCVRNDAQHCMNSATYSQNDYHCSVNENINDNSVKADRLSKKHRSGVTSKGSKPRLKSMGSSSSMDGNSTSGFISRDSSTDHFTDQTGVDLLQFFKETLNRNPKDRTTLLRIEDELLLLANAKSLPEITFPATSSYNRMLIHRVAAFFGMEHNVDSTTQQCVIVAKTKSTRIPDIRFKSLLRERMSDEPRKSILKRDSHSFEDPRQGFLIVDRGVLDRKSKSFEEREEEYEKTRRRIFRGRDFGDYGGDEPCWHWSSAENSEQSSRLRQNKMLKVQSLSTESRGDGHPNVSKSHSFGGYGGPPNGGPPLTRGDSVNSTKSAGPRLFSKQDSTGSNNAPWHLSPSSSGYKTQTQSLRSDSVTPSPTGYGSDDHTPEPSVIPSPPAASCGIVWAVTDMASVPRGSVLINPQTLQPIVNQDGSVYHFDPSNLPPSQAVTSGVYNNNNKNFGPSMVRNNRNENKRSSLETETESSTTNIPNTAATLPQNPVENLSESSSQSVVKVVETDEIIDEETSVEATKENTCDIQEESVNSAPDECDDLPIKDDVEEEIEEKPTLKSQATSPNIPSPVPSESPAHVSEVPLKNSSTEPEETNCNRNSRTTSVSSSPLQQEKKDESKATTSSTMAMMNYTTNDSAPIFSSSGNTTYPTQMYQQAPDGSVYAVSQPMVYAYPPPLDGEFQGYFMPVYDQSGQRDTGGLVPTSAQAIYQSTNGTTVVPVAYQAASFGGAPIYPGQVVYSPEQYAPGAASTAGQMQQYQMTYPVGYSYPYNGCWGQAMTYYVPPPHLGNTVSSSLIPPPIPGAAGPSPANINNISGGGKRNSPPQQNLSSGQSSQSATPANTYQLTQGVPFTLATDPNSGQTVYAIPQASVFPNMLPYGPPSTPSAAPGGVLTHIPPHQPNAVISPLISHPGGPPGPSIPVDHPMAGYTVTNANNSHGNNSGTPQSAPSTPLSNSIPLPHQQRNPPLFSTPPMLPNGYNPPMHNQQNYGDHTNPNNHSGMSGYEKKNLNGGGNNKKGSNTSNYVPNGRQNNYINQQQNNQRKINVGGDIPSNQNGTNRQMHITQQKRMNNEKNQMSNGLVNNNSNSNLSGSNPIVNSDKGRNNSGIRPKPGNLDLRRNASQRNSPSTNSLESNNNSPNSIASNHIGGGYGGEHNQHHMYVPRSSHMPPMHPPTAAAVVAAAAAAVGNDGSGCHQPLIGAYNHHPAAQGGMYIKYAQPYFAHPSVALPNNRRSPSNDLRPSLAPLTGVYPAVNMMLPAPRHMQPRHPNPNYKGNKPSR